MIHIRKKKTIHTIFWHLEFCIGCYILEITDGQSWSNYIGPKRDIPHVCLTRQVFTHFSLKVAWSGISLIEPLPPLSVRSAGSRGPGGCRGPLFEFEGLPHQLYYMEKKRNVGPVHANVPCFSTFNQFNTQTPISDILNLPLPQLL